MGLISLHVGLSQKSIRVRNLGFHDFDPRWFSDRVHISWKGVADHEDMTLRRRLGVLGRVDKRVAKVHPLAIVAVVGASNDGETVLTNLFGGFLARSVKHWHHKRLRKYKIRILISSLLNYEIYILSYCLIYF